MSGALDGIRVIDFGQYLAGPLTAMMFADNGADVIRVDPPGGPRWKTPVNAILQRGKRSIVLDLKHEGDRAIARKLIDSADVVIENFRPGVMDRLGLGAEEMTAANPRLIYTSIPAFSADDPRADVAGWEGVVSAAAGLSYPRPQGRAASEVPLYNPVPFASVYASIIAGHATTAALIARERSGLGQRVEAAIFDAALQCAGFYATMQDGKPYQGGGPERALAFNLIRRHMCADGKYVDVSPPWRGVNYFVENFMPEWVGKPNDPETVEAFLKAADELFLSKPAAQWERDGEAVGTGIAVCQTTQEWLHDQHALDSRCVVQLEDPELGQTYQAGFAISLTKTPSQVKGPRHALDSDRDEILAELNQARSSAKNGGDADLKRALDGYRVIDTTQVLAGPTSARLLAEYGADVIKINNPGMEKAQNSMHVYVNNGKRSILLDLKSVDGQEILHRLIETTDVFHQNFARGVSDRLRMGESDVREQKPDVIYSTVNAHQDDGFRRLDRGHEELGQAITGMQVRLGGDGLPERAGWPICDYSTGHFSAFANTLALFHRLRTGEGQHTKAALSASATYLQIPFMIDYEGRDWDADPKGNLVGEGALYRYYPGSDRWFFLAAHRDGDLATLANIDGLSGIESLSGAALEEELVKRFANDTAEGWSKKINAAGLGAHPTTKVHEIMPSPLLTERQLSVLRNHDGYGELLGLGPEAHLSRTPMDTLRGAPEPGWDTEAIVQEVGLGEKLPEMLESRAVATS